MIQDKDNSGKDLQFVSKGFLSIDVYKNLMNFIYKRNVLVKILALCDIGLICIGIWAVKHHEWPYLVICLLGIAGFTAVVILNRNHQIKVYASRMKETCGTDSVEYMCGFTEDEICSGNNMTDKEMHVAYEEVRYACDTGDYLFILTKGMQFFVVFKNTVAKEEYSELLGFLREKHVPVKK